MQIFKIFFSQLNSFMSENNLLKYFQYNIQSQISIQKKILKTEIKVSNESEMRMEEIK